MSSEPSEIFGPLFVPKRLEKAALLTLYEWLPTYMEQVRLAEEYGPIRGIRSWLVLSDVQDRFVEDQLPALTVESPGTRDEPEAKGDGSISAEWDLGVVIEFAAPNLGEAREIAQMFSTAIWGVLLQRRGLGDLEAAGVRWLGAEMDVVEGPQSRTRFVVANAFAVDIDDVVNWQDGPATPTPPEEIASDWPTVEAFEIEIRHRNEEDDDDDD